MRKEAPERHGKGLGGEGKALGGMDSGAHAGKTEAGVGRGWRGGRERGVTVGVFLRGWNWLRGKILNETIF